MATMPSSLLVMPRKKHPPIHSLTSLKLPRKLTTASGHVAPPSYSGASYQVLKTGTHTNRTHWQYTAKCSGCTSFAGGSSNTKTTLNANGVNHLAFAYSATKPSNPSSSTSTIPVHDVYGYWDHDFSVAGNAAFATLVTKNGGH